MISGLFISGKDGTVIVKKDYMGKSNHKVVQKFVENIEEYCVRLISDKKTG